MCLISLHSPSLILALVNSLRSQFFFALTLNLVYVLHFQIERFNVLLRIIKSSLIDLEKGIKGLVVMSSDLEETFNCIFDAKVPPLWGKVSDLIQRTSLLQSQYNKRDKG